ncbi:hypothetical protein NQ318_002177 [Aromia moschata]|uniref:Uncharacterized protein n=1 Tax=Aromia moschata TaxID=1265417 RepID=A0AAV8Z2U0_9CUCU|nr:hypothetical protein NQ318_002177 [Aromia moschata]
MTREAGDGQNDNGNENAEDAMCLIGVILDEEAGVSSFALHGSKCKCLDSLKIVYATRITSFRYTVPHLCPHQQLVLAGLDVFVFALPGLQHGGLESTAVAEVASSSDWPPDKKTIPGTAVGTVRWRAVTVAAPICSGVALAAVCPGVTMLGFSRVPSRNTLYLVYVGKHCLCDLLAPFKIVIAVRQNLGLDNGHDAVRLAYGGVPSQNVGVLDKRLDRGRVIADLQHAAPLGEVAAVLLVLSAAFAQVVQT